MLHRVGDPTSKSSQSLQQPPREEQEAQQHATAGGAVAVESGGMLCLTSDACSLSGALAGNMAHAQRMGKLLGCATSRPGSPTRQVISTAGASFSHHTDTTRSDDHHVNAGGEPTWLRGRQQSHHEDRQNGAKFLAAAAAAAPPSIHRHRHGGLSVAMAESSGVAASYAPLPAGGIGAFDSLRVLQVGGSPALLAPLPVTGDATTNASHGGSHSGYHRDFLLHPTRTPMDSSSDGPSTSRASGTLPQGETLLLFNERLRGKQGSSSASLTRSHDATATTTSSTLPLAMPSDPEVQYRADDQHEYQDNVSDRPVVLQRAFFAGSHGTSPPVPEESWRSTVLSWSSPVMSDDPTLTHTLTPSHTSTRTATTSISRPPLFSQLPVGLAGSHDCDPRAVAGTGTLAGTSDLQPYPHPQRVAEPDAEAAPGSAADPLTSLQVWRAAQGLLAGSGASSPHPPSHTDAGTGTGTGTGTGSGSHSSLALPFRSLQEAMAAANAGPIRSRSRSRSRTGALKIRSGVPRADAASKGAGVAGAQTLRRTGALEGSGSFTAARGPGLTSTFNLNPLQGTQPATSVVSSTSQLIATSSGPVQAALMAALQGSGAYHAHQLPLPLAPHSQCPSASLTGSLHRQQSSVSAQTSSLRAALPPSPHPLPLGGAQVVTRGLTSSSADLLPVGSLTPATMLMHPLPGMTEGNVMGRLRLRGRDSPSSAAAGQLRWPFNSSGSEGLEGEASRILRMQPSLQSSRRLSAGSSQWGASSSHGTHGLAWPAEGSSGAAGTTAEAAQTRAEVHVGSAREAGILPTELLGAAAGAASPSRREQSSGSGQILEVTRSSSAVRDLKQQQQHQQPHQPRAKNPSHSPQPSVLKSAAGSARLAAGATDRSGMAEPVERCTVTPDTVADASEGPGGNTIAPVPVLRVTSSTEKRLIVPRSAWAQNLVVQHLAKEKGTKEERGKRGRKGWGDGNGGKGSEEERRSQKRAKGDVGDAEEGVQGEESASHGESGSVLNKENSSGACKPAPSPPTTGFALSTTAAAVAPAAAPSGAGVSASTSGRQLESRHRKAGAAAVAATMRHATHQQAGAPPLIPATTPYKGRRNSPVERIAPLRIADSDASKKMDVLLHSFPSGLRGYDEKQQGARGGQRGGLVDTVDVVLGTADAGDGAGAVLLTADRCQTTAGVGGDGGGDNAVDGNERRVEDGRNQGILGGNGHHLDGSGSRRSGVMVFGVWMAREGGERG